MSAIKEGVTHLISGGMDPAEAAVLMAAVAAESVSKTKSKNAERCARYRAKKHVKSMSRHAEVEHVKSMSNHVNDTPPSISFFLSSSEALPKTTSAVATKRKK